MFKALKDPEKYTASKFSDIIWIHYQLPIYIEQWQDKRDPQNTNEFVYCMKWLYNLLYVFYNAQMKEEPPSLKFCKHMENAVHWAYSYFKANETMLWGIRGKLWDFSFD